jgi:hypothetical protein
MLALVTERGVVADPPIGVSRSLLPCLKKYAGATVVGHRVPYLSGLWDTHLSRA